jgi:hypothetical protein
MGNLLLALHTNTASHEPFLINTRVHLIVMAGHRRSKNGVASLAYDPAIHVFLVREQKRRGCPAQGRA